MSIRFAVEEIGRHLYPVRGGRGSPGSAQLGVEAHLAYARSRAGADYEAEIPVEMPYEVDGRTVLIGGRIDGIERTLLGDVILEVKTHTVPPQDLEELERRYPQHLFQVRLYGWMRQRERQVGELRIVLLRIRSDGTVDLSAAREITVPPADIRPELELGLRSLLLHQRRVAARRRRRPRIAIADPFTSWRSHQESIISFLDSHPRAAVVSATGSGKTAPTLVAALPRAFARGEALFWATAKTLGQPPVMETARRMRERGGKLRVLRMTAQERLCRHGPEGCPALREHRRRTWDGDLWKVMCRVGFLEASDLNRAAELHGVCARALQDELAPLFDLLVGDYNFVLDPHPLARNLLGEEGAAVIDEAHNVYERVRDGLSATVTVESAQRALDDRPEVRSLASRFFHLYDELPPRGRPEEYSSLLSLARQATALFAASVEESPGLPFLQELGGLVWPLTDEVYPRVGLRDGEGIRLVSVDPAPFVASRLTHVDPLVLLSATLDPPEVHLSLAGLSDLPARVVDDPFAAQRHVVMVPAAGSRYREREREAPRAAAAVARLVRAHPGRYLAFASSYAHAALVARHLESEVTVILQEAGMDRSAVHRMALAFCDGPTPSVLVAPAGGLLGEGIDLPPGLSGVFLLGPALPAVTDERRAIQEYHDSEGRSGFALAFLVPGLSRVVQAAGRVVRREGERAWVILLDRRFAQGPYRSLLPSAWRELPAVTLDEAVAALERGWE